MTDILIANASKLVSDKDVAGWVLAVQRQVHRDFAPFWGVSGELHFNPGASIANTTGAWLVTLKDAPDDPGDLGFHIDEFGQPQARIFVEPTLELGERVSAVLSHEILEMLADPLCTRMAPDGIHIVECADPVQESRYDIDGVEVSNFVTPAYFGFNQDTRYDFSRQLDSRCDRLLPGGYLLYLSGGQWQRKFGLSNGVMSERAAKRARASGRSAWRARRAA